MAALKPSQLIRYQKVISAQYQGYFSEFLSVNVNRQPQHYCWLWVFPFQNKAKAMCFGQEKQHIQTELQKTTVEYTGLLDIT